MDWATVGEEHDMRKTRGALATDAVHGPLHARMTIARVLEQVRHGALPTEGRRDRNL